MHAPGRRALYMLPAAPEADELQQLPLELPRYPLVALRESGGHRAYALLPPYAGVAYFVKEPRSKK